MVFDFFLPSSTKTTFSPHQLKQRSQSWTSLKKNFLNPHMNDDERLEQCLELILGLGCKMLHLVLLYEYMNFHLTIPRW